MLCGKYLKHLLALACLASFVTLSSAQADTLRLTGVLEDASGNPLRREQFRLVLGSDPAPRNPDAGRMLVTDAQGRFALEADVTLTSRRVKLDSVFTRHSSKLLEIGFEFDLLGQPALHWVELDFIANLGPLRGIKTFVAGQRGAFDQTLVFHSGEHSWSIPGDKTGMRLSDPGTDVQVEEWDDSIDGQWRLDLRVIRQEFTMR
jgi:hypothetical protein